MLGTVGSVFTQEQIAPLIRVVRFVKPDVRPELDSIADEETPLFRSLRSSLDDLPETAHVIFNFGLIERFPTSFFQVMLRVRQLIRAKNGHVYLCGFRPEIRNAVELMGGSRLFIMTTDEQQALLKASRAACT